jgi:carboxylate-amine ligase
LQTSPSSPAGSSSPTPESLRAAFDAGAPYEVGLEDEVMLLDPATFALVPRAAEVLSILEGDPRFKLELPASQIEIITPPSIGVPAATASLLEGRRDLAAATDGLVCLAAAGVHPFSPGTGELNRGPRYEHTIREHGLLAARQLVCALQVHVSVGRADRALRIYNAARSYLPELAALAANAPFYEGCDTGLASVRPKLAELLPRQGVPPPIESWESYAAELSWGVTAGRLSHVGTWWWELRLHPRLGTLEFRVPDGQTTVADAAAIAAVAQALVAWLDGLEESDPRLAVAPTWRIEENRWSACRDGVDGSMADLSTGNQRLTRECLGELLDALAPVASRLGAGAELGSARALIDVNGAIAQRDVARDGGVHALTRWLAARFQDPAPG